MHGGIRKQQPSIPILARVHVVPILHGTLVHREHFPVNFFGITLHANVSRNDGAVSQESRAHQSRVSMVRVISLKLITEIDEPVIWKGGPVLESHGRTRFQHDVHRLLYEALTFFAHTSRIPNRFTTELGPVDDLRVHADVRCYVTQLPIVGPKLRRVIELRHRTVRQFVKEDMHN